MLSHLKLHFNNASRNDESVLGAYPSTIRRRVLRHLYLDILQVVGRVGVWVGGWVGVWVGGWECGWVGGCLMSRCHGQCAVTLPCPQQQCLHAEQTADGRRRSLPCPPADQPAV